MKMKKRCFLLAVSTWASALLLFICMPCHADLVEMSDHALEGISGQAGIILRAGDGSEEGAELFAAASNFGNSGELYHGDLYASATFLQDWIVDDMNFDFIAGNPANEIRMTSGIVSVERIDFGAYDFGARYSGNVHLYTPVD